MFRHKFTFSLVPMLSALTLQANDPMMGNDPFGDDIFNEMYEMQKQMDKVFQRMHERIQQRSQQLNQPNAQFFMPAYSSKIGTMFVDKGDYYEYNTGVEANKENEINLSVHDGLLTFKAKITKTLNEKNSQHSYTSMMQRSQTLPQDADTSTVKMEEQGGVLVVTVRKTKAAAAPIESDKAEEKKTELIPVDKPSLMPSHNPMDENKTIKKVPYTSTQG